MDIPWEEYWWGNITGPRQFVSSIVDGLLDRKTMCMHIPLDLPWRHEMRRSIQTLIKQKPNFRNTSTVLIDAVDEGLKDNLDIGRYLLDRFGQNDVIHGYRSRAGGIIQSYLIQHEVLKDTLVWVKGLNETQAKNWVSFCRSYPCPDMDHGLFILESSCFSERTDTRNVKNVAYEDYVCRYDLQLFNGLLLNSSAIYSDKWKQYIATLASHLCATDAELSEFYIRLCDFLHDEPLSGLHAVLDTGGFDKRGTDVNSSHVLALMRRNNTQALLSRIWAAQLQILFPLIEMKRMQIIEVLQEKLETCLRTEQVEQFGQVITDIKDIELGTLVYLMAANDANGYRMLYVPDEQLRSDIHFLRECRNTLAHGSVCPVASVKRLLGQETQSIGDGGIVRTRVS